MGRPSEESQGFKPDPGNLAVRDYRGASGNVSHGETVNPSCNRKSRNGNPSPTAGRARFLSQWGEVPSDRASRQLGLRVHEARHWISELGWHAHHRIGVAARAVAGIGRSRANQHQCYQHPQPPFIQPRGNSGTRPTVVRFTAAVRAIVLGRRVRTVRRRRHPAVRQSWGRRLLLNILRSHHRDLMPRESNDASETALSMTEKVAIAGEGEQDIFAAIGLSKTLDSLAPGFQAGLIYRVCERLAKHERMGTRRHGSSSELNEDPSPQGPIAI